VEVIISASLMQWQILPTALVYVQPMLRPWLIPMAQQQVLVHVTGIFYFCFEQSPKFSLFDKN